MKLKGKAAIITGAGQGIGKAIALSYAKEGANLSLNVYGLDEERVKLLVKELTDFDVQVIVTEGDITDEKIVKELVTNTMNAYGRIDILVNNAGILTQSLIQDMSVEMWDRMIEVDLKSVFLTTRQVVPYMISQKSGRIINTASQLGQKGGVELSHYAAAKAGVIGFTKSIALELGKYGITANCIAPGPIETELVAGINEEWKIQKRSELAIPRFGKAEEVAPTAVLLASDPDGNIYTGQTLGPNSGDVMI
ncbi:3-oxoacyl-ACP reductase [Bacillus canaveralius]|uniref:3-oxoacyl-ACP reductase n=1 Tax=Bacillus canaveralius TaxID=1403243 RepID=A0A2N5GGD8_9BACI|nr:MULTISPECIES: 3-oxoacyl-ACP reductase family protein [Bacillus]PLR79828.1 3-oxoacyl-ACP reductase [Bacillus canaveralius]PLR87203.1 3-oxoacyl-ACP reductase [Bacillus sp. V33-4]PLR97823.1 3-oxoacyl-ACP reductase [Bacillus canaveralius]RSK49224.1 3-oxoacyl-ACP reductase FabG [Bacillus canaveralius]